MAATEYPPTATIRTPRLGSLSKEAGRVDSWLNLIRTALSSYLCRTPSYRRMVDAYVSHLELQDAQFVEGALAELEKIEDVEGRKERGRALKLDYLKVQTDPPELVIGEGADPLWLQALLFRRYYGGIDFFDETQRASYREEILKMTNLSIIDRNNESIGGGGMRTPSGTFSEQVSQYFLSIAEKGDEDRLLSGVWDLFSTVRASMKSLSQYMKGRNFSPGTHRIFSPAEIEQQLIALTVESPSPSPPPSPSKGVEKSPSSPSISPLMMRLPLDQIKTVEEPIFSPRDDGEFTSMIQSSLKVVGNSISTLLETCLDPLQKRLIEEGFKSFPEPLRISLDRIKANKLMLVGLEGLILSLEQEETTSETHLLGLKIARNYELETHLRLALSFIRKLSEEERVAD